MLVNHLWPSISLLPAKNQNQFSKVKLYSLQKNILNFNKNISICYFVNFWLAWCNSWRCNSWSLVSGFHLTHGNDDINIIYLFIYFGNEIMSNLIQSDVSLTLLSKISRRNFNTFSTPLRNFNTKFLRWNNICSIKIVSDQRDRYLDMHIELF